MPVEPPRGTGRSARRVLAAWSLFAVALFSATDAAAWRFTDGAAVHPAHHGVVPTASDVVFSTRSTRADAKQAAAAFGATRVEWVYTRNRAFNEDMKRVAPWLGATLGATWKIADPSAHAQDFDGQVIVHPRMKAWGGQWLTTNAEVTRRTLFDAAADAVAAGADSIQFDDPLLQWYAGALWGGDFHPATLAGFPAWLRRSADPSRVAQAGLTGLAGSYRDWLSREHGVTDAADYRRRWAELPSTPLWLDYLKDTVATFHRELRAQTSRRAGRTIPLSMNLTFLDSPDPAGRHAFLARIADYSIAETPIKQDVDLAMRAASHRYFGLGWVPSILPDEESRNRYAIALLYALGGTPLVPWDTYVGNDADGQPRRYYGEPGQYADLYRFVRNLREWMDGHESVALVGLDVDPAGGYDAVATRRTAQKLWQAHVPFAFLGADRRTDAVVARWPTTPGALEPTTEQIDALRPFLLAPGSARVRVVPRARPDRPDQLVLHVVDAARGALDAADPQCRRRIGIRRDFLGPFAALRVTRQTLAGPDAAQLDTRDPGTIFVSLTGCSLWEVLVLHLDRPTEATRATSR